MGLKLLYLIVALCVVFMGYIGWLFIWDFIQTIRYKNALRDYANRMEKYNKEMQRKQEALRNRNSYTFKQPTKGT